MARVSNKKLMERQAQAQAASDSDDMAQDAVARLNMSPEDAQAERDTANQLLGRIQLGQGLSKLVTVTTLLDLQKIKETKSYRHLKTNDTDGKSVTVTTFQQFCVLLGCSYEKINADLQNLQAFGADALENMQRAGLGYRELRRLRKMPDDDKQIIVQEIEADIGDKESLLELIDQLSAKHSKEKSELESKLKRAEIELEATQDVLSEKSGDVNKLQMQLAKEANEKPAPDAKFQNECQAISDMLNEITNGDDGIQALRLYLAEVWQSYDDEGLPPSEVRAKAAQGLTLIIYICREVLNDFGLREDLDMVEAMCGEQFYPTALDMGDVALDTLE